MMSNADVARETTVRTWKDVTSTQRHVAHPYGVNACALGGIVALLCPLGTSGLSWSSE